jgi:LCP family protein required for cell wall assembly
MLDENSRSRRPRHSRSSSGRRSPREISRLDPSASREDAVRQTANLRPKATRNPSPAARKRRRRRLAITIGVLVAILVLGGAVGAWAYVRAIGNKINGVYNSTPALQQALETSQTAAAGAPFYMVLLGSDQRRGETAGRSDTLMVARVDPQNKKVQLISIPRDSRVAIPGYGTTKINAAYAYGGAALTIKTVKQLTGLPISHYVDLNFYGFSDVVNAIGGVWINVPWNIYDPAASGFGVKYATLHKGYQKLDGPHALTFARTRHFFASQDYQRINDQQALIKAIASQALSLTNVFKASSIIDAVATNLGTDMSPAQLADLALQFKGMGSDGIDAATAPSTSQTIGGISYVILDTSAFDDMIGRMKKGLPLVPETAASSSTTSTAIIKPDSFQVTVRNGAGVSGLSKQAAAFLTSKGFKAASTGNMNQYVYGRTLIVYQKGYQAQAQFTRDTLGFGDVIPSAGMYTFSTQVMVVIGKDWKDPATGSASQ